MVLVTLLDFDGTPIFVTELEFCTPYVIKPVNWGWGRIESEKFELVGATLEGVDFKEATYIKVFRE